MTEARGGGPVRFAVDGRSIEARAGDSLAVAMLRAGEEPGRGGTLCLAGDCGNCLAVVDGVAFVRTCQTVARPGAVVARHPADANPPLPDGAVRPDVPVERRVVETVVVGGGPSGRLAASRRPDALVLDAG